ncbi:MAG: hypothetical protein KC731_15275, partial [Myxococcales bacterium]|nr:hypothetical protein [Myxococcales bacterium]
MSRFGRLVSLARGTGQTMVDTLRWRSDPDFVELVRTAARVAPGAAKLALPWLVKARRGHE